MKAKRVVVLERGRVRVMTGLGVHVHGEGHVEVGMFAFGEGKCNFQTCCYVDFALWLWNSFCWSVKRK